jgi:hypothetical protein
MIKLTLLVKTHSVHQSKQIEKALNVPLGELNVEAKILDTIAEGWVQVGFEGEDENIAATYATNEFGVCPASIDSLKQMTVLKGYITDFEETSESLSVDVGIFQPKIVHATIPLHHLQTQLVESRKIPLKKIAEIYGFCEDLPLEVKVTSFGENESGIEAMLSDDQVKRVQTWQASLLDRLVILGLSLQDIKNILKNERLERDIIDIEAMGLLEHALTCKLGTDAAGLIPRIGRKVRRAKFAVFNPKKLLNLGPLNRISG